MFREFINYTIYLSSNHPNGTFPSSEEVFEKLSEMSGNQELTINDLTITTVNGVITINSYQQG